MTSSARSQLPASRPAQRPATTVVNLRREPYDVYIGRPGKGQSGPWGNPFRLESDAQRGATLQRYREWLDAQIAQGKISRQSLAELSGKRLGCFCKPQPCHGDILAAAADQAWQELHGNGSAHNDSTAAASSRQPNRPPAGSLEIKPGADLFAQNCAAIVNTVNCVGAMGKGLALTVKQRFPACDREYRQLCRQRQITPGSVTLWRNPRPQPGQPQAVLNFATKDHWRQPSQMDWIEQGLPGLVELIQREGLTSVAVPPLGCGLGGLDWNAVKPRIVKAMQPLAEQGVRAVICAPAGKG